MAVHDTYHRSLQMSSFEHTHGAATSNGASHGCCGHDHGPKAEIPSTADVLKNARPGQFHLRIPDMDCPTEEGQIRRALERFKDVRRLSFDLTGRVLSVDAPSESWSDIRQAVKKAGFDSEILTESTITTDRPQRNPFLQPLAALAVATVAEAIAYVAPETAAWKMGGIAIAGLAIALSGFSVFKKGIAAILRGQLNINALMAVAVSGAFVIGEWPEAAMVMALYAIAELIEARAVERARHAIKSLLDLSPQDAEVLQGDGQWKLLSAVSDRPNGAT